LARAPWIETSGIRNGRMYDVVDGVRIIEANRATVYERYHEGIVALQSYLQSNYLAKGVKAVLYGVRIRTKTKPSRLSTTVSYAVFCIDGFLTDISNIKDTK
jgi:hypothetical protein